MGFFFLKFKVQTFRFLSKNQTEYLAFYTLSYQMCIIFDIPSLSQGAVKLLHLHSRPHTRIPFLPFMPSVPTWWIWHVLHKHIHIYYIQEVDLLCPANDHSKFVPFTQQLDLQLFTWLFTTSFPDKNSEFTKIISQPAFPQLPADKA